MKTKSTMMSIVAILLLTVHICHTEPDNNNNKPMKFHIFYNTHTDFSDHEAHYNGSHLLVLFDTDVKKKSESFIHQIATSDLLHWQDQGNVDFQENIRLEYLAYNNSINTGDSPALVLGYYFFKQNVESDAVANTIDHGATWKVNSKIPSVNILSFVTPMRIDFDNNSWIALTDDYEIVTSQDLQNWNIVQEELPSEMSDFGYVEEVFNLVVSYDPQETSIWVAFIKTDNGTLYQLFFLLENSFNIVLDYADVFDYGPDFFELAVADGHVTHSKERLAAGTILNKYYDQDDDPGYPLFIISSMPRLIHLEDYCYHRHLHQKPAISWYNMGTQVKFNNLEVGPNLVSLYNDSTLDTFSIYAEIEIGTSHEVGFRLLDGGTDYIQVGYRSTSQEAFLDRSTAYFPPNADQSKRDEYFKSYTAPLQPLKGLIQIDVFVDGIVVEVFFNTDEVAFTAIVFPSESANAISAYSTQGTANMSLIKIGVINN